VTGLFYAALVGGKRPKQNFIEMIVFLSGEKDMDRFVSHPEYENRTVYERSLIQILS
jgi:hypothetical protein